MSKREQKTGKAPLLNKELKGVPTSLIRAKSVGEPQYNNNKEIFSVPYQVSVDQADYRKFVDRFRKTLKEMGFQEHSLSLAEHTVKKNKGQYKYLEDRFLEAVHFRLDQFPDRYVKYADHPQMSGIFVCTRLSRNLDNGKWYFYMPDIKTMQKVDGLRVPIVEIKLLDSEGRAIDFDQYSLGSIRKGALLESPVGNLSGYNDHNGDLEVVLSNQVFIEPLLTPQIDLGKYDNRLSISLYGRKRVRLQAEFSLTPADVKDVSRVVYQVKPGPAAKRGKKSQQSRERGYTTGSSGTTGRSGVAR